MVENLVAQDVPSMVRVARHQSRIPLGVEVSGRPLRRSFHKIPDGPAFSLHECYWNSCVVNTGRDLALTLSAIEPWTSLEPEVVALTIFYKRVTATCRRGGASSFVHRTHAVTMLCFAYLGMADVHWSRNRHALDFPVRGGSVGVHDGNDGRDRTRPIPDRFRKECFQWLR
jgi:hypothetical protein